MLPRHSRLLAFCEIIMANFFLPSLTTITFATALPEEPATNFVSGSKETQAAPWLRLNGEIEQLKLSPNGRYLAYISSYPDGLFILDSETREIFQISKYKLNNAFVWSPEGFRLFFREVFHSAKNNSVLSELKSFDVILKATVSIQKFPKQSSFLTLDPVHDVINTAHRNGIASHKLIYPSRRQQAWQKALAGHQKSWVVAANGILIVDPSDQKNPQKLKLPDSLPIDNFAISPRGDFLVWQSTNLNLFMSDLNGKIKILGKGRDPSWHSEKNIIIYSAPRYVGNKVRDYDLKMHSISGVSKFITQTAHQIERFPSWNHLTNSVVFSVENSTDIFSLKIRDTN
ncbi:MAG: hypothetical protein KBD78_10960 [Oligoflexales bacterium]|nr:hypothetical protein [Oligoflexales bacterium]